MNQYVIATTSTDIPQSFLNKVETIISGKPVKVTREDKMEEKVEPLTVEEAKKYIGNIFSHEGRYVELVAVVEVPLGPYAIILSSPCDKPTVTHVTNLFFIP